ncbi:MAG: hypothetical protein IIA59_11980 [Candidatus Marinimicrobia bacterium]|nr:hypothetical protein [Candidatus Neomarinimicrobiota bacterium]
MKTKNVIIDKPQQLSDEIEGFRLDAIDAEANYTVARLRLCRDSQSHEPVLFYSQELSRNFKNPDDPFARRHLIRAFVPGQFGAAADEAITSKFQDSLLAHKPTISDYSPLSDIHSEKMSLFMDEETAQFLEDQEIRVDGLAEDFQSIESISANAYMEGIAFDASQLKRELGRIKAQCAVLKGEMADHFEEPIEPNLISEDLFAEALARQTKMPQGMMQSYLLVREQMVEVEKQLGEFDAAVFSETASKICLPKAVELLPLLPAMAS